MGHVFSVEMKSKNHAKNITISNEAHDRVLFEGELGELEEMATIGGSMLEVRGNSGVLRIELGEDEMRKLKNQLSSVRA